MKCLVQALVAFLLCGVVLTGCPPPVLPEDEATLRQRFENAVEHASALTDTDICRDLTAIVSYNDALEWEDEPGTSRVKMVTWTSYPGYVPDKTYITQWVHKYLPTRDLWVTASPQLRDFAQASGLPPEALELRLKQLLGMPHDTERTYIVTFWVHPEDLFRPSPDPEVTDHAAELAFPPNTPAMTISDAHRDWIDWQRENNDWPWTGLGYTYDWGNPDSIVGLSEFVIRAGAEITVISVSETHDYFGS